MVYVSQKIREKGVAAVQVEADGVLINLNHILDHAEHACTRRFHFEQPVEAIDHILRFHLLAVMELHTLAEVERPLREVFVRFPGFRQHPLIGIVRIVHEQLFVALVDDV